MATVLPFHKSNSLTDVERETIVKLDKRLDEAAEAREVLADLADQEMRLLLAWLVCGRVENLLITDFRLDETRESTYEAAGAAADILLCEVEAQGSIQETLESLVVDEIHRRQETVAHLRLAEEGP